MTCGSPLSLWTFMWHQEQVDDACQAVLGDLGSGEQGVRASVYALAFVLTCLLEAPWYLGALRPVLGVRRCLLAVVVVNLCTHPLVVFGLPQMLAVHGWPYAYAVVSGEILAPVMEWWALVSVFRVPVARAGWGAVSANLCSWLVGVWLTGKGVLG